jgi:dipeptidyl aminopeptidase/acylaminoacyl peptidase
MKVTRKFKLEDISSLKKISGPRTSPDGTRIVFSVMDSNYTEDRYETQLYMVNLEGKMIQLTKAGNSKRSPIWSPNSEEIAFISDMEGSTGIWALKIGERPRKITDSDLGVASLRWSPSGEKLLFTSRISLGEKRESDVLVIDRLPYKVNGLGFIGDKWNHLFTVETQTRKVSQITNGKYDISYPVWNCSGSKIAYLSNKNSNAEILMKNDIWVVNLETGAHERLTDGSISYRSISFSPNGKWLAAIGNNRRYGLATKNDIYVIDLESSEMRNLTKEFISKIGDTVSGGTGFDLEAGLVWSIDSNEIYFLNAMKGNYNLYKVSLGTGDVTQISDSSKSINSFSFSRTQEVLTFLASDMVNPSEIWLSRYSNVKKLTRFNDVLIDKIKLSLGEKFILTASDGVPIECWYYEPVESDREKKPLVLLIKGGPHMSCWGNAFNSRLQLLTANGYAVLLTNERGTGGYGEEFAKTARAKFYGQREYQDIMEVLDYVLENYPINPDFVNVMGYSRGGFLTNWIITHTNRFNSAITAGGFCDVYSFFSTGDYMHIWCEKNYEGTPWDDEELYMSKSPIRYVKNITTPTLIMHAMQDYRASVTQAEQLYISLKRLRKDVEMVLFPGENHELPRGSSPKHLREYNRHMLRWFDKYNNVS